MTYRTCAVLMLLHVLSWQNAVANHADCSFSNEDAYSLLRNSRGLVSTTSVNEQGHVRELLGALNCLVSAEAPTDGLLRLLENGTISGQLYALIGLFAVDRDVFDDRISKYLQLDAEVVLFGGDVVARGDVRIVSADIAKGLYADLLPPRYRAENGDLFLE